MRAVILSILLILFAATAASAHDVLVVQGLPVKPFEEAYRSFRNSCTASTRRVYLSELEQSDLARLVREEKPLLLVAIGSDALKKAAAIRDLPVVYMMVVSPPPGIEGRRNITGVSMIAQPEKQLAALKKCLPKVRRLAVVYHARTSTTFLRRAKEAAAANGIELVMREVQRPQGLMSLLGEMIPGINAIWMLPDEGVYTPETTEFLFLVSQQNGLPVITFSQKYLALGAVVSLDVDAADMGRQAGEMAKAVLEGTPVADIPVEGARRVVPHTNRKVADKLGVPLTLLYESEAPLPSLAAFPLTPEPYSERRRSP